jgi:DNA-binding FrmR family transcriptional regulator
MLLAAIRGGVNSLMAEILEDHIRICWAAFPSLVNRSLFFVVYFR